MTLATSRGYRSDPERLSDLVSRVDLVHLVESYAGPGRASGGRVTFSCPHPSHPDRHPSFTVSRNRSGVQVGRCWSVCGFHGDALDLLEWLEGWSTAEAARWLRDNYGSGSTRPRPAPKKSSEAPAPPRLTVLRESPPEESEAAARFLARYLEHRGWPVGTAERFSLSVVRDSAGTLRVRHPFYAPDEAGTWRCVYWQDRGPRDARVKWLSAKGATPTLYNLRSLEADELTAVVLCEGPADAITATLALEIEPPVRGVAVLGVPGAGAWQAEWSELLTGLRVIIVADPDEAGDRLVSRILESLGRVAARPEIPSKDLSDWAKEAGLPEVREELVKALRSLPVEIPEALRPGVELLLGAFPGARIAGGEM